MAKKSAKSLLHLIPKPSATDDAPTRSLGPHGMDLWARINDAYSIEDAAGRELLTLACQQLDRAEALREQIDREGEVVPSRYGLKDNPVLKHELAARAFVAKTLLRLGLNVEPVRPVPGRPAGWRGHDND